VRGAEQARQEIHFDPGYQMAGQPGIEETDPLPTAHDPAHELERHGVQPERPIGHLVLAEARVPLDDVAMHRVGFWQGEAEPGVIEHEPGQAPALGAALEPAHRVSFRQRPAGLVFQRR